MGGDDPERRAAFQVDVDDQRAARLQSRQRDLMDVAHQALPEQHDIAVPAMGGGIGALDGNRDEPGLLLQPGEVEQAVAGAEAFVGLLQGDDVRGDLADHLSDPAGVEAAIDADAFMDIVGGDQCAAGATAFAARRHGAGAVLALAQRGDDAGGQALVLLLHRSAGSCSGPAVRGRVTA